MENKEEVFDEEYYKRIEEKIRLAVEEMKKNEKPMPPDPPRRVKYRDRNPLDLFIKTDAQAEAFMKLLRDD